MYQSSPSGPNSILSEVFFNLFLQMQQVIHSKRFVMNSYEILNIFPLEIVVVLLSELIVQLKYHLLKKNLIASFKYYWKL